MVKKAIGVILVPKPGKEAEVEAFLKSGLALADNEPLTVSWYAVKLANGSYGIFDTFDSDEGRDAYLNGKLAAALMAKADELFVEPPKIEKLEILAAKLPARQRAESSVA